jgi:hypothetical protein
MVSNGARPGTRGGELPFRHPLSKICHFSQITLENQTNWTYDDEEEETSSKDKFESEDNTGMLIESDSTRN